MMEWIVEWVKGIIETLGYPGLLLMMFLENIFPPIPSEVVLPLAGSLTLEGVFTLAGVTLVGAVGSVAGAWLFYALGRWYGPVRTRQLIRRYGRWLLLDEDDLDRSIVWFHRHGEAVILFGRMAPLVRSLISVPAGVARMSPLRFTLFTAIGTAGWSFILALAGRVLGENWHLVGDYVAQYEGIILALLLIAAVVYLVRRIRRRSPEDAEA